jgi:hypothetical protein
VPREGLAVEPHQSSRSSARCSCAIRAMRLRSLIPRLPMAGWRSRLGSVNETARSARGATPLRRLGPAERVSLVLGAGRVLLRLAGCLLRLVAPTPIGPTGSSGVLGIRLAAPALHPCPLCPAAPRTPRGGCAAHARGAVRPHMARRPLSGPASAPCAAAARSRAPAPAPDWWICGRRLVPACSGVPPSIDPSKGVTSLRPRRLAGHRSSGRVAAIDRRCAASRRALRAWARGRCRPVRPLRWATVRRVAPSSCPRADRSG